MSIRDDFERDQRESRQAGGSGDPDDEPEDDGSADTGGDPTDGFTGEGGDGPGSNDDDDRDPDAVDRFVGGGGVSDDRQADRRESRQTRPAPDPEPDPSPSTDDDSGREPTPDTDPPADFDTEPSTLLGPEAPGNPTDDPLAVDRGGNDDPSRPDAIPGDPFVPDDRAGVENELGQLAGPEEGPADDAVSRLEARISRQVEGTISTERENFNIRRTPRGGFAAELTERGLREAGVDLDETVGGLPTVDDERLSPADGSRSVGGGRGPRPGFGAAEDTEADDLAPAPLGPGREATPDVDPPPRFDGRRTLLLGPEAATNPTNDPLAVVLDAAGDEGRRVFPAGDDPLAPDTPAAAREVGLDPARSDEVLNERGVSDTVAGLPTVRPDGASEAGSGASLGGIGPLPGFGVGTVDDRGAPADDRQGDREASLRVGGLGAAPQGFAAEDRVRDAAESRRLGGGRVEAAVERSLRQQGLDPDDFVAVRQPDGEIEVERDTSEEREALAAAAGGGAGAVEAVVRAERDPEVADRLTSGGLFADSEEDVDDGLGNDRLGTEVAELFGLPSSDEELDAAADTFLDDAPILPTQEELRRGGAGPLDPEDPSESPATEGVGERLVEGAGASALSLFNLPANVGRAEDVAEIVTGLPGAVSDEGAGDTAETLVAGSRALGIDAAAQARDRPARSAGSLGLTVAASGAAAGGLPRGRDLAAEFDPRVGPFGTTLETRAVRGARSFLADDRGQLDLGGPRSRGDDSGGAGPVDDALDRFEEAQRGTFERRAPDPLAPDEGRIGRDRGGPSDRFDPDSAGVPPTPETDLRRLFDVERRLDDATEPEVGGRGLSGALAAAGLTAAPPSETRAAQAPAVARPADLVEPTLGGAAARQTDPDLDTRLDADTRLDQRADTEPLLDLDSALDLDARVDADTRLDADQRLDQDPLLDPDPQDPDPVLDPEPRDPDPRDPDPFDPDRPGDREDDDEERGLLGFGVFGEQFRNPVAEVDEFLGGALGTDSRR